MSSFSAEKFSFIGKIPAELSLLKIEVFCLSSCTCKIIQGFRTYAKLFNMTSHEFGISFCFCISRYLLSSLEKWIFLFVFCSEFTWESRRNAYQISLLMLILWEFPIKFKTRFDLSVLCHSRKKHHLNVHSRKHSLFCQ